MTAHLTLMPLEKGAAAIRDGAVCAMRGAPSPNYWPVDQFDDELFDLLQNEGRVHVAG